MCSSALHFAQVRRPRQFCELWPNRWHLKHRRGFGIYGLTRSLMYPASMESGSTLELKVSIRCLVWTSLPSRLILIRFTLMTFCSLKPSRSSASVSPNKSSSETTPRVVFMVRCGVTINLVSPNFARLGSLSYCFWSRSSKRRSPLAILDALYPGPKISVKDFETRKGESVRTGLPGVSAWITWNRGKDTLW